MKTVNLDLTRVDGNAFYLIGAFQRQAKREGWMAAEIKTVVDDCMSGNYDHLLQVLIGVCEPISEDDE